MEFYARATYNDMIFESRVQEERGGLALVERNSGCVLLRLLR